jgi:hypothetical protein
MDVGSTYVAGSGKNRVVSHIPVRDTPTITYDVYVSNIYDIL